MDVAYTIRRAVPRDAALLPAIELAAARLFLDRADELGLTPAMLERVNSAENLASAQQAGLLWVAVTAQDAPVGFALLCEIDGALHLDELDVHPAHGRRGIGTALLERVCEMAASAARSRRDALDLPGRAVECAVLCPAWLSRAGRRRVDARPSQSAPA